MRRAVVAVLVGSAAVLGAGAKAEPMLGSRGELLDYVQAYAKCTVRYSHQRAQELVLSNVSDERLEQDLKDIYVSAPLAFVSGCRELVIRNGVAFRLQPGLYRAALAQELIVAEMNEAPIADFSGRAPLQHWSPKSQASYEQRLAATSGERKRAKVEAERDAETTKIWLAVYGECVVRRDPTGAWTWILSKTGGPGEKAAISRLNTALGECLASGKTLNFPKDVLRGSIAISYYRLAKAPAAAAAGVIH